MENDHNGVLQKMAEFIARTEILQETAQQKMPDILTILDEKSYQIDKRIKLISSDIKHFREMTTRMGATKLRQEAEKISVVGQEELKHLENIYRQTKVAVAAQCEHLNKASMNTVKNVSQLIGRVRHNHLQELIHEKTTSLDTLRTKNLSRIGQLVSALQWKNLVTVILATVMTAMIISLYVDNAWPWQAHRQVMKERTSGKVLLHAWPALSPHDQETIIQYA